MNNSQLECFATVADCLNFSRAAESLYMSQTSVTYQIASLEKELGTKLFNRDHQGVSLTPSGQELLAWASKIISFWEEARARVARASNGAAGHLALGCYGDVLQRFLPDLLADLREDFSGIRVSLRQCGAHELVSALNSGELDVAVMTPYGGFLPKQSGLETMPLFDDDHMAVLPAGHPLASRESLTPSDLRDEPMLFFAERDIMEREDPGDFRDARFLDTPQSVTTLVEAGMGATVCVSHVCDFKNPRLAFVPMQGQKMTVAACYRKNAVSPECRQFLGILAKTDFAALVASLRGQTAERGPSA